MKGWIVNSKLKYKDTKGPLELLQEQETDVKKGILKIIHNQRSTNK